MNNLLDLIFDEDIIKLEEVLNYNINKEINFIDKSLNITPLICAIDTNNIAIVELILKHKANPNFTSQGLSLPLIHAMEIAVEAEDYGNKNEISNEVIIKLLEHGAKIDEENYDGLTPYEFSKNYHIPAQKLFESIMNKS